MRKTLLPILLGIATAISVYFSLFNAASSSKQNVIDINQQQHSPISQTSSPHLSEKPLISQPQQLIISKIHLKTRIDPVGLTEKRAMQDPPIVHHAAWYELGPKPGEKGNAVLAGHYDDEDGPAIFYQLEKLDLKDAIIIQDEKGKLLTFQVVDKKIYSYDDFPITEVFGTSDEKRINLITCAGKYNEKKQTYEDRLVVSAKLVETNSGIITRK